MSGNLLSKNHPFRASVTHGSAEIAPINNNTESSSNTTAVNEEKSRFNLSNKTKIIGLCTLGVVITYGWINIYDSIYPEAKKPLKDKSAKISSSKKISYEDVTDFEWGISDFSVDELESKPSWFKQTFCRGVKRSFFCR